MVGFVSSRVLPYLRLRKIWLSPISLESPSITMATYFFSNEITQVKITETENPHEAELKVVQEESYRDVQEFSSAFCTGKLESTFVFIWLQLAL